MYQFIITHCGNKTIDYGVVEDFVFNIEEKYKVKFGIYNQNPDSKIIVYDKYSGLPEFIEIEFPKSINDL